MNFLKEKCKSKLRHVFTLLFFLFFLFIPEITEGFAFSLGEKQLAGLSEVVGPVLALGIFLFAFLIFSYGLLVVATEYLLAIIISTPDALTLSAEKAPFVDIGWQFILGISNMLLILAFIVIAISVILRFENLGFKKAFPRLIGVALLINFSLVFVGMGIDISNVFFSTIENELILEMDPECSWQAAGLGDCPEDTSPSAEGNCLGPNPGGSLCCCYEAETTTLISESMEMLFSGAAQRIINFGAILAGFAAAMLIPYVSVGVQFAVIIAGVVWFSDIMAMLTQGLIMFLLAGAFFLFFIIFLVRIFVIQILAIVAPLAFICLIFPGTQLYKYFEMWVRSLLQWLFAGIAFLFLLILGFNMVGMVDGLVGVIGDLEVEGENTWVVAIKNVFLDSGFVYYIVLLVYFVTILFFGKKFIPAGVDAMISQAKSVSSSVTGIAGKAFNRSLVPKRAQDQANVPEGAENMANWMRKSRVPGARLAAPTVARWAKRRKDEAEKEAKEVSRDFRRMDQVRRAGGTQQELKALSSTGTKRQRHGADLAWEAKIGELEKKKKEVEESRGKAPSRSEVEKDLPIRTGESTTDWKIRVGKELDRRERQHNAPVRRVEKEIESWNRMAPHLGAPNEDDIAKKIPKVEGESRTQRKQKIQKAMDEALNKHRSKVGKTVNDMSPSEQASMLSSAYDNKTVVTHMTKKKANIDALVEKKNYKNLRRTIKTFNKLHPKVRQKRRKVFDTITATPAWKEAKRIK